MSTKHRSHPVKPVGTQAVADARPAQWHALEHPIRAPVASFNLDDADETAVVEGIETKVDVVQEDRLRARRMRRVRNRPGPTNWLNFNDRLWLLRQRPRNVLTPALDHDAVSALTKQLEVGAASGQPHPTLASASWMREVRYGLTRALLDAFSSYPDTELRTVTVLNSRWTFTPETLDGVTAARIKARFRQDLIRVGVTAVPDPLFAVLHGEFEPTSGAYVLHFHLATTAEKARALMMLPELIKGYCVTATGAAPVRRSKVRDRPRQFTYLAKSYWPSRPVVMIDGRLKRVRKAQRIPEPFGTQVLLWLDRQRFADMVLMNDVWSMRRGGSAVMKRLYLFVMGVG